MRAPAVGEVLRERFAAHVEESQVGQLARRILDAHRAQERGRRAERADAFLAEPRHQVRPGAHALVVHRHERRSHGEGEPRLLDARVVRVARALRHAIARAEAEPHDIRAHQAGDAGVLDHHALRRTGGAARVDEVGEVAGARCVRAADRGAGREIGHVEHWRITRKRAHSRLARRVRQHRHRQRVVDHRADVPVGKCRVHAAERAPAPHGGKLARVDICAVARQHHQDDRLLGALARRRNARCDRRCPCIEFAVRQRGAGASIAGRHVDGHAVRVLHEHAAEDGVKRVHASHARAGTGRHARPGARGHRRPGARSRAPASHCMHRRRSRRACPSTTPCSCSRTSAARRA